jgi:septum site-determining protein MinD
VVELDAAPRSGAATASADGTTGTLTGGVEDTNVRTLKTVFFMDCLPRYEGAYGNGRRLHERERVTGQRTPDIRGCPLRYAATVDGSSVSPIAFSLYYEVVLTANSYNNLGEISVPIGAVVREVPAAPDGITPASPAASEIDHSEGLFAGTGQTDVMVEAVAIASGKGGTGKTTTTLALGMALAEEYDVTVVDADTGMANLLFHAGLDDVDTTLHDVLLEEAPVERATYDRFGMRVVPCGTSLAAFEAADPGRLREVVATLASDTDVLLLDSPATLSSKSAVLPVVLADRTVIVLEPTIPALSDGLKVGEYAAAYGTGVAGVLFNKVRGDADRVVERAGRYFDGPTLGQVPACEAARAARRSSEPLLAHAPESEAARAYRRAAGRLDPKPGAPDRVADRFRSAVIPDPP